jgi:uncharacterized protein YsxB (DUF464 family)
MNKAFAIIFMLAASISYSQTSISITLKNGIISEFDAKGHSGYAEKGYDIVCAVITSTLRTYGKIMSGTKYFKAGGAPAPGSMWIKLENITATGDVKWAQGMSDFAIKALLDLQNEYPKFVKVSIDRIAG